MNTEPQTQGKYTVRTAPPTMPGEGVRVWIETGETRAPGATVCETEAEARERLTELGVPASEKDRLIADARDA